MWILLLLLLLFAPGWAQTPASSPDASPSASVAATPIPLAEIATELELAESRRRELLEHPLPPELESAGSGIGELRRHLLQLQKETQTLVVADPSLNQVRLLLTQWTETRAKVTAAQALLLRAATTLDAETSELSLMNVTWTATCEAGKDDGLPPALMARLEIFPRLVQEAREILQRQRSDVLGQQAQLSDLDIQAKNDIQRLSHLRAAAVERIFLRDGEPLWSPRAWEGQGSSLAAALTTQWDALGEYTVTHLGNILVLMMIGGLVAVAFSKVRTRVAPWVAQEPSLAQPLSVFQAPLTMTLILSLLFLEELFPDAPRLFNAIMVSCTLIPSGRLLARLVDRKYRPILAFFVLNFLVDKVRHLMEVVPLGSRLLFLFQTALAAVFVTVYLVGQRQRHSLSAWTRAIGWVGIAAFTLASLANLGGFINLATVSGDTALEAGYVFLMICGLFSVLDAVVLLAFLMPPLGMLTLVRRHRLLLRSRVRVLLGLGLGWLWLEFVLDELSLLEVFMHGVQAFLHLGFSVGELRIEVINLLTFGAVMIVAGWVSRFLRFVLEEDVFPRIDLPKGLPYAFSTVLHYLVLLGGFFVAMSAWGVDVGRFTFLAGALGVGIGLGLQNIVNNFVSGIILLFERPVKVGDTIKVGQQTGELIQIGLRASVVRTWEGLDVILPNGSLMSSEVTNTSSLTRRRVEIKLGVAYGTNPRDVLKLLKRVAVEHPDVLPDPPPDSLFLDFGDSALLFQLRLSTLVGDASRVRSELLVTLSEELAAAGIDIPFPTRTIHMVSDATGSDAPASPPTADPPG